MKTSVTLFDQEFVIKSQCMTAVCCCLTGINATSTESGKMKEITFGTKVYHFKILETGSAIFKLYREASHYYVVSQSNFFIESKIDTEDKIKQITVVEEQISNLVQRRTQLLQQL